MNDEQRLRYARWQIDRARGITEGLPSCGQALEAAYTLLGQLAGDYREGEETLFETLELAIPPDRPAPGTSEKV